MAVRILRGHEHNVTADVIHCQPSNGEQAITLVMVQWDKGPTICLTPDMWNDLIITVRTHPSPPTVRAL